MFLDYDEYSYCIQPGRTDMRGGEMRLVAKIQEEMSLDPFDRVMFLFCGSRKHRIKILVWDGSGFWLMTKRLEKGTFAWPNDGKEAMEISREDVERLLRGEDVFRRIKTCKNSLIY